MKQGLRGTINKINELANTILILGFNLDLTRVFVYKTT